MERLVARVGRYPVSGLLVTLVAILAMWRDNLGRLAIENVWPTAVAAMGVAALAVLVLWLATRDWRRAGLAGGLLAVYCFYVPPILGLAGLPRWAAVGTHVVIMLSLVALARRLPHDRERAQSLAGKVNLIALLILSTTAIPIAVSEAGAEGGRRQAAQAFGDLSGRASNDSPDVWHILFDRYAGLETFRSAYAYDNRPFVAALRARGFTVQDDAFANYQRTGHSVASTLNGALLDPLGKVMADQPGDWVPIYRSMRDNAALGAFNRMGYRTVFAGSWWEPTRFSDGADRSIEIRTLPQLARLAIERSSIGFWTQGWSVPFLDGRGDQCFRANEKFRRLRALAASSERKQVFAHFLVPHPPFVLNADGSCRSLAVARGSSRRDNYLAQVEVVNRETLALIDAILAGPRRSVIVIHSDEGPWPEPYVGNEHGLGTDPVSVPWAALPPQKLREKMAILLAVRDPGGAPQTMPTSPVQIYPAILRDHFGSSKPLPPSNHSVFESDRALYRFTNVDRRLNRSAKVNCVHQRGCADPQLR